MCGAAYSYFNKSPFISGQKQTINDETRKPDELCRNKPNQPINRNNPLGMYGDGRCCKAEVFGRSAEHPILPFISTINGLDLYALKFNSNRPRRNERQDRRLAPLGKEASSIPGSGLVQLTFQSLHSREVRNGGQRKEQFVRAVSFPKLAFNE